MSGFRVALIQISVTDEESAEARFDRGLSIIETVDKQVRLVILPELWMVGFFNFSEYIRLAEPLNGPTVNRLSAAARRGRFWLHGGSVVERSRDGTLYNTSLLLNPEGQLTASYRKIHLFGYQSQEKEILRGGDSVSIVQTELGNWALTTCYDLRFPELYRCLSRRGAEVMLVASAWPSLRLNHWVILTRARAIENLAYVLACNATGLNRSHELAGNSMIVDPWGTVVSRLSSDEAVLYGEIDLKAISAIRSEFPALRDHEGIY